MEGEPQEAVLRSFSRQKGDSSAKEARGFLCREEEGC